MFPKGAPRGKAMVVRLTRKLAGIIDDIDLRSYHVGQMIDLPWREALLLMAEGWAEMIERRRYPRTVTSGPAPTTT